MNDYRITCTSKTGEESNFYITERTEAAARKYFNSTHKDMGLTIQSVELHQENVCATKRQERETLEAIKKMVAELGPQSYLATAFEGCFEDAESNIENDFGDSMKARWLHADAQLNAANSTIEELKEQLEESKKDWEAAHAAAHEIADQKDTEIKALRAQVLSPDDLEDVRQLLSDRAVDEEHAAQKAAEDIVKYADRPESKEFQDAVRMHRNYVSSLEYTRNLLARVSEAGAATRAA